MTHAPESVLAMDEQTLRVKVAEAVGWKRLGPEFSPHVRASHMEMPEGDSIASPPPFSTSHDAILPVIRERMRLESFRVKFANYLMEICNQHPVGCVPDYHCDRSSLTHLVTCSAADLARAFLLSV